jgi:hypothetical protein
MRWYLLSLTRPQHGRDLRTVVNVLCDRKAKTQVAFQSERHKFSTKVTGRAFGCVVEPDVAMNDCPPEWTDEPMDR